MFYMLWENKVLAISARERSVARRFGPRASPRRKESEDEVGVRGGRSRLGDVGAGRRRWEKKGGASSSSRPSCPSCVVPVPPPKATNAVEPWDTPRVYGSLEDNSHCPPPSLLAPPSSPPPPSSPLPPRPSSPWTTLSSFIFLLIPLAAVPPTGERNAGAEASGGRVSRAKLRTRQLSNECFMDLQVVQ